MQQLVGFLMKRWIYYANILGQEIKQTGQNAHDDEHLTHRLEPLIKQLHDIHTRLETKIVNVPETRTLRARQAMNKVEGWQRDLSGLALRSLSRLHQAPG